MRGFSKRHSFKFWYDLSGLYGICAHVWLPIKRLSNRNIYQNGSSGTSECFYVLHKLLTELDWLIDYLDDSLGYCCSTTYFRCLNVHKYIIHHPKSHSIATLVLTCCWPVRLLGSISWREICACEFRWWKENRVHSIFHSSNVQCNNILYRLWLRPNQVLC